MKTELYISVCLFSYGESEEISGYICLLNVGILKQGLKQGNTFLSFSLH